MKNPTVTKEDRPDGDLIAGIRDIYFESFPPSERIEFNSLAANFLSGRQLLFTAKVTAGLAGFATTIPLSETNLHLLEYMAVKREYRNQGLGALLLKYLLNDLAHAGNITGLVLEVESDNEGTESERSLRKRRIEFYSRLGARQVECAPMYRIPDMVSDGTISMKLMWIPIKGSIDAPSGRKLRDCIQEIYYRCYGKSKNDPLVLSVIRELLC